MKNSARKLTLAAAMLAVLPWLAGCATTQSAANAATTQNATMPLNLAFEPAGLEQKMVQVGVLGNFKSYWQAHVDRNWSARYDLEHGIDPARTNSKFYTDYHAKAWVLKSLKVTDVVQDGKNVSVQIEAAMVDPTGKKADNVFSTTDVWLDVDGQWKHVNLDAVLKSR
jgi:outer membrane murein-binding lipoprotein Lpp